MTQELQTEIADSVETVARSVWSDIIDWRQYVPEMIKVVLVVLFAHLIYRFL